MAKRTNNPSLSSLLPIIVLGGAALYFLTKSGNDPNKPSEAVAKIQSALNNVLYAVDYTPGVETLGVPYPYNGLFDQRTADAYKVVTNILALAQTKAGASLEDRNIYQVLPPAGIFKNDKTVAIAKADGKGESSLPVSLPFLVYLLQLWYAPEGTAPLAIATMRETAQKTSKIAPDRLAMNQAAVQLYPSAFIPYS